MLTLTSAVEPEMVLRDKGETDGFGASALAEIVRLTVQTLEEAPDK